MLEGLDKKHSYDKWWLSKDMENMGYFFEYCNVYANRLFGVANLSKLPFLNAFMLSNIRRVMETGHPHLLSEAAEDSFEKFVNVDLDGNISHFAATADTEQFSFAPNQLYWVGWTYAYCHYEADMYSSDLITRLPLDYMLQQYHLGHEMDISVFYEHIKNRLW